MSSSYRRVAQREDSNAGSNSEGSEVLRSRSERLQDKLVAFGWIGIAILVARWTNFFATIWSGDAPNRTLLRIATLGFGIVTALILYLTVYLPRVKGLVDSSARAWSIPRRGAFTVLDDTDHGRCGRRLVFAAATSHLAGVGLFGASGVWDAMHGGDHVVAFCADDGGVLNK
eukprot:CAMPEP_0117005372 /NCGR_PEP_ID=MMETSP0472-20121206/6012_1 /TAXON_ID=693140 ORGANISM="Tiarina fusus, Strain LIS" /NCGR_SAMPLE_ID=MMETSP0472 /ASSEMBLY_ACC=CAM_ASM_000603 /LENGTH=171 /DNA_ID=CAMNT_0004706595 /DNA_START=119 /DNA_END=635 /DNA_ORIENTATION=-